MNQYRIAPADSLKRINDYLLTFVGEIEVKLAGSGAKINYPDTKLTAILTRKKNSLELVCQDNDSVTVNLIKNTGVRIFSQSLKAYLPNDPNLLPVDQTNPIFTQYGLKPIFRYRNSLVFFCLDNKKQVHLVNRHLLEYLNQHPDSPKTKDFSLVVAKNIGQFIALVDRGLIPLDYYAKVPLTRAIKRYTYFKFDKSGQKFIQTGQELNHAPKKYLAIKINQDVNYILKNQRLIPILNVSVFLD